MAPADRHHSLMANKTGHAKTTSGSGIGAGVPPCVVCSVMCRAQTPENWCEKSTALYLQVVDHATKHHNTPADTTRRGQAKTSVTHASNTTCPALCPPTCTRNLNNSKGTSSHKSCTPHPPGNMQASTTTAASHTSSLYRHASALPPSTTAHSLVAHAPACLLQD